MSWPVQGSFQGGYGPVGVPLGALGDSLTQSTFPTTNITSLSRSGGVVTAQLASSPTFGVGAYVDVVGVTEDMGGKVFITSSTGSGASSVVQWASPGADGPGQLINNPCISDLTKYADSGFLVWAGMRMGWKFDLVAVEAGRGRTSAEALAKAPNLLNKGLFAINVLIGTNDAINGIDPAITIANIDAIYKLYESNGILIIADTVPPLAAPQWSAPKAAAINQVNDFIRQRVRTMKAGGVLIDIFAKLVEPLASSKGIAKPNMLQTSDGTHWVQNGCNEIAKLYEAAFAYWPLANFRTTNNGDSYSVSTGSNNLQPDTHWTNTGGNTTATGMSGTLPVGNTAVRKGSTSVAFSAPLRADGVGYDIQAAVTSTANNDGMQVNSTNFNVSPLVVGSTLQIDVSVKVTGGGGNLRNVNHLLSMTVAGASSTIQCLFSAGFSGTDCVQEDLDLVLRSPKVPIQVVPANGFPQTSSTHYAAGNCTIAYGRPSIRYTKP